MRLRTPGGTIPRSPKARRDGALDASDLEEHKVKYTMSVTHIRTGLLSGSFVMILLAMLAACGDGAEPAATPTVAPPPASMAPTQGAEQTAKTASYRIQVLTGPLVMEAAMMRMSGIMSTTDQGQPVNRHLEVHIFDISTGAVRKDVVPTVRITDQATGTTRQLADVHAAGAAQGGAYVMACIISEHRPEDRHFGDNVYLPDGSHTVTVEVDGETAAFDISL